MCDGVKLEVFDREENLEKAILSFKIIDLIDNFDKLRNLVSPPMQIWFFYKRRVLKSIDKAFESEFNLKRVDEFKSLIEDTLLKKRGKILRNFQSMEFKDMDNYDALSNATIEDIIDGYFFSIQSIHSLDIMNKNLINNCKEKGDFHLIYKMFPDEYRDINESYITHCLYFLINLDKEISKVNWSPSWLNGGNNKEVSVLIEKLVKLSLTYFRDDEARKIILLSSLTYRRIFKILSIILPEQQDLAKTQHLFQRYNFSEFSWNQIISSENRSLLINLDVQTTMAVFKFVKKNIKIKSTSLILILLNKN